eukprot:1138951-Pelagomonas_calceolata.AAC.4
MAVKVGLMDTSIANTSLKALVSGFVWLLFTAFMASVLLRAGGEGLWCVPAGSLQGQEGEASLISWVLRAFRSRLDGMNGLLSSFK